jgi:hypothetical protein
MFVILFRLMETKAPKNFIRAFLLFLRRNLDRVRLVVRIERVMEEWKRVSPELLESYCEAFNVGVEKYLQS